MVKTFLGLGLKAGVKLVLWIHLIENMAVYLITALSAYNINTLDKEEFAKYKAVFLYQVEFENRLLQERTVPQWWSFSLMFPLLGVIISFLCLIFEKSKICKVVWFCHQGFSIVLLFSTLADVLSSHNLLGGGDKAMLSIVFTPFIALKFYSCLVIDASVTQIKFEERKEKFGAQWITNSLLYSPNSRLTLPTTSINPNTVESYERF